MLSLIVLIEDRIETVFKDEHPSKAETPIDVINEGIVILVIFVDFFVCFFIYFCLLFF